MSNPLIPEDLGDYLKSKKQLEYDASQCVPGQISLLEYETLEIGEVYIDSEESPLIKTDPHAGEIGYYAVPAVNLVADCDGFDPDGILIWLPDQKCYGTWDCDHYDVLVFPHATWTEILANPLVYINAQWKPQGVLCQYFVPFPKYPFHAGRPWETRL
jgi:hypothetical protein